jgi:adenylate cyclase
MLAAVAVLSGGIATVLYATELFASSELQTLNARFRIRGTEQPEGIRVVAVDDVTFSDLNLQWPFPRSLHARVIDRLRRDGARAIAYDVQFTEPTKAAEDNALIAATARAGNVALSTTEVDRRGRSKIFGGDEVLREIGARAGNSTIEPESNGWLCRFDRDVQGLVTLPVATAEIARGRRLRASAFPEGRTWVDYVGPPGTVRTVSFSSVLRGRVRPGLFRDQIVVVGAAAPSLQDVHPTCARGNRLMPGPEIQANAISTVLRGFPLRSAPLPVDLFFIVLLGLLPPLISLRLRQSANLVVRMLRALAFTLAGGGLYLVLAQLAFNAGWIVPAIYPLLAVGLSAAGALMVNYATTAIERARTRELFGRFVPSSVVDRVVDRTGDDFRLGGERVEATVLFSDIRGFTTFSESMPAEEVIKILNRYLEAMSDAILDHGGTLTAYIGDGIMAVFGAPIEQPDHADRALAAAREMLGPRLAEFNRWVRDEEGLAEGFRMGVGLNSGPIMAGNVGSERRCEYTAIGDTVNTASRIEGMTKGTPHQLFIADSTREALAEEPPDLVYVEEMPVRGRRGTVKIWSIADEQGETEEGDQVKGLVDGE